MDLSCYTLSRILETSPLKDATSFSCPSTPGPSVVYSLEALPIIHEDQPFEAAKAKTGAELDTFVEELNEVLTFDGGVLEVGEIIAAPVNL